MRFYLLVAGLFLLGVASMAVLHPFGFQAQASPCPCAQGGMCNCPDGDCRCGPHCHCEPCSGCKIVAQSKSVQEMPSILRALPSVAVLTVRRADREKPVTGAGFVVDPHSVVTCYHVVTAAASVTVAVAGDIFDGTVEHTDKAHDLAVVRVKSAKKLKPLTLTDGEPKVTDDVAAIGHPLRYQHSVSTGIVSALGREIEMPSGVTLTALIQHTAPISVGNSGGPLLNLAGDVVGMNTAYNSEGHSIAFAVSAKTIRERLDGRGYALLRARGHD